MKSKSTQHVFKRTLSNSSTEPSGLSTLSGRDGGGVSGVHGGGLLPDPSHPDVDVCTSRFESLSYLSGPWAVDGSFVSYKGIQGGFEELWTSGAGSAEEPGFFSGMVKGVSDPCEGSKILTFLFRPRLVCRARSYISEARGRRVLRSSPGKSQRPPMWGMHRSSGCC